MDFHSNKKSESKRLCELEDKKLRPSWSFFLVDSLVLLDSF